MKLNFTMRLVLAVLAASMITLTSGCQRYRVLDSDKQILRVKKGQKIKAERDGYFVPDARMLQIGEALNMELLKQEVK
jgi:hypothetical protein